MDTFAAFSCDAFEVTISHIPVCDIVDAHPISVWDMSHQECDIWEGILQKALTFAVKVSQTRHSVVFRFIELLGETKLASYVFFSHVFPFYFES